jgi:hypothetical protein
MLIFVVPVMTIECLFIPFPAVSPLLLLTGEVCCQDFHPSTMKRNLKELCDGLLRQVSNPQQSHGH